MTPPDEGPFVLALDQGGSSSRAIAFDAAGVQVASASVRVGEHREDEGRVEQDPEELVASLRTAAGRCANSAPTWWTSTNSRPMKSA